MSTLAIQDAVERGSLAWEGLPSLALALAFAVVGGYLVRAQVARGGTTGWSLSGLALAAIFPTCALMHLTLGLGHARRAPVRDRRARRPGRARLPLGRQPPLLRRPARLELAPARRSRAAHQPPLAVAGRARRGAADDERVGRSARGRRRVPGAARGDARVRLEGVEPPRGFPHGDLNAARLPIPPQPQRSPSLAVRRQCIESGVALAVSPERSQWHTRYLRFPTTTTRSSLTSTRPRCASTTTSTTRPTWTRSTPRWRAPSGPTSPSRRSSRTSRSCPTTSAAPCATTAAAT